MEIWMAISIGLLGSLHCLGMCGPIALALPLDRSNQWEIFRGTLFYNSGRIGSYFLMGFAFGFLGKGINLMGLQQYLSILIGILIILGVLSHTNFFALRMPAIYQRFIFGLKQKLGKAFQRKSSMNLLGIGFLNGFLPCGLVYMAIAGAISSSSPLKGGIFMLAFGLGTLPLMWAIGSFGSKATQFIPYKLKKYLPLFLFLLGMLFILRGSNLDLPFISPMLVEDSNQLNCH